MPIHYIYAVGEPSQTDQEISGPTYPVSLAVPSYFGINGRKFYKIPSAPFYSDSLAVASGASVTIATATAETFWILYELYLWVSVAGSYIITDGGGNSINLQLPITSQFQLQIPPGGISSVGLNNNLAIKNNTAGAADIHISAWFRLAN